LARDACATGQAKVAHAVGKAKVDHFGHRSLVGVNVSGVLVELARGTFAMDVGTPLERFLQVNVAADVGHDAQLDLAVVGGEEGDMFASRPEGVTRRPDTR